MSLNELKSFVKNNSPDLQCESSEFVFTSDLTNTQEFRVLDKKRRETEEACQTLKKICFMIPIALFSIAFLAFRKGHWLIGLLFSLIFLASPMAFLLAWFYLLSVLKKVNERLQTYYDLELEFQKKKALADQAKAARRLESNIHPYFKRLLAESSLQEQELKIKAENFPRLIKQLFTGSEITLNRYETITEQSFHQAFSRLEALNQAVETCASENEPDSQRKEILESYLQEAARLIAGIDGIIDELLKLEYTENTAAHLDHLIKDLRSTTQLYARKSN